MARTFIVRWRAGVESGTTVTLSASLPDGETDTGKWVWDDGVAGRIRTLTVDKSGVYVLTYENEKGVKSTQSFTVAAWGDGATATLNSWINYNAENHPGTVLAMGKAGQPSSRRDMPTGTTLRVRNGMRTAWRLPRAEVIRSRWRTWRNTL